MSDELRAPLVKALATLADDLVVGRLGDPHVGFVVLVSADAPPVVVVLSPSGAVPLTRIQATDKEDEKTRKRFFSVEELDEAETALRGAGMALRSQRYALDDAPLGERVRAEIERIWTRHREYPIQRALEVAAREAAEPFACACGQRYKTERGLKTHRSRSPYARCVEPVAVEARNDESERA